MPGTCAYPPAHAGERQYPGTPVLTFGAGQLEHAHSDRERVHVPDLIESIIFVTLFVLRETVTCLLRGYDAQGAPL
jgi:acetylornithine deacetylase/succinyl-diaminopimelate desuccinylase-like protein